jgi:hypothetical protein
LISQKDFLFKNVNLGDPQDMLMLEKGWIPLGSLGEHHREHPSATVRNHYIGTFWKLLFIKPPEGNNFRVLL